MRLEMASSLSATSLGGGGHTSESIMSSVCFSELRRSGGSVMHGTYVLTYYTKQVSLINEWELFGHVILMVDVVGC